MPFGKIFLLSIPLNKAYILRKESFFMFNKKSIAFLVLTILLFSTISITPNLAQQPVYVVSNNIDIQAKPLLDEYFSGFGLFPDYITADEVDQIRNAKLILFLGGPDAPFTGPYVSRYLDPLEISFIRQAGQRFAFIKSDPFEQSDKVIIIAGSDRERTYSLVSDLVEGQNISFQTEIQRAAEGRISVRDLPLVLVSVVHTTETVQSIADIYLKMDNFGQGRARNVVVEISEEYYNNFTLQSVDPEVRVEGNRFYVGDIEPGEFAELTIVLRARQSGTYSGTLSYIHDAIDSNVRIRDITTRVP